jgi:monovalent cation/proton antiporter MnhG/PhaG subunit
MSGLIVLFLTVAVAAVWLGSVGFLRLSDAFDRQHCVSFVGVVGGLPVLLAAWMTLGNTETMLKILFLVICMLLNGATLCHATGRSLYHRREDKASP